jgi:hypothetical protein
MQKTWAIKHKRVLITLMVIALAVAAYFLLSLKPTQSQHTPSAPAHSITHETPVPVLKNSASSLPQTLKAPPPVVDAQGIFQPDNSIPEGFENLSADQVTLADVYFQGRLLGSYDIRYNSDILQFTHPKKITSQLGISNLRDNELVTQTLSGELPTNASKICQRYQKNFCGILNPKVAGVIFNANKFRVDVFVSRNFVKKNKQLNDFIPPSTADWSFASYMNGSSQGTNKTSNYNIYTNNVLAYKQLYLNSNVSYADTLGQTSTNKTGSLQVSNLNANYNYKRYVFSAGAITTSGGDFLPGQQMLGASGSTSLDTLTSDSDKFGTPLIVYLPLPSKVSIYRDGRLYSSQFYSAGQQTLNSSTLPNGSYEVTLVIEAENGSSTEETQFYSKSNRLPPLRFPQFSVQLGYLQNPFISTVFPKYSNTLLVDLGYSKRLSASWGIKSSLFSFSQHDFLSLGITWLNSRVQIESSLLQGNEQEHGVGLNTSARFDKLSSSLYLRKMWSKERPANAASQTDEQFNNYILNVINGNSTQEGLNVSYTLKKMGLSFQAYLSQRQNAPQTYNVGPNINFPVFQKRPFSIRGTLSYNQSPTDKQLWLNLSFSILPRQSHWSHFVYLGYRHIIKQSTFSNINSGLTLNTNSTWQNINAVNRGWRLTTQLNHQPKNQNSAGLNLENYNKYGYLSITPRLNVGDNYKNTQYIANFRSHFIWVGKQLSIGGSGYGTSGALIRINTPDSSPQSFNVYVNNQLRGITLSNRNAYITLTPFRQYAIRIKAAGKSLFSYPQSAKMLTLYKGNVQKLVWQAREKILLLTTIVTPDGKPIPNRQVDNGVGFNQTEQDGSLQIEVFSNTHELMLPAQSAKACVINLPLLKSNEGLASINRLVCHPIK